MNPEKIELNLIKVESVKKYAIQSDSDESYLLWLIYV